MKDGYPAVFVQRHDSRFYGRTEWSTGVNIKRISAILFISYPGAFAVVSGILPEIFLKKGLTNEK